MIEGRESILDDTVVLQKLLTYAKTFSMFYKIVQKIEDESKSFQTYIWNIEAKFAYDERSRITETLDC